MRILLSFLIFFSLSFNSFADEGKQENILRIEKFEEKSKVIQLPQQSEAIELMDGKKRQEEDVISLDRLKQKKIERKVEKRFFETLTLNRAWSLYSEEKFKEAADTFKLLINSSHMEIAFSSRLGLGYSLKNLKLIDEAVEHFEYLYGKNYRKEEASRNLVEIFLMKEDFDKAEKYSLDLEDNEREKYSRLIEQASIRKIFIELEGSEDRTGYLNFLREKQRQLDECILPEIFFEVAKKIKDFDEAEKANQIFKRLLSCSVDLKLRLGIIYELSSSIELNEILSIIEKESESQRDDEFLEKLSSLKLELLRKKLSLKNLTPYELENTAKKILEIAPEDISTKTSLAWHYYNQKQYERALEIFSELSKIEPLSEDYILGTAYCHIALGKDDEVIELVEKSSVSSKKLNSIKADAYIRKADKMLKLKDYGQAFFIINKLSSARDSISRQKAAQWYCRQEFPLLAVSVDFSDKDACYYREQYPQIEIDLSYRYKSGDRGFSKLKDLKMPLSFLYPMGEGQKLSLRFILRYVDSGSLVQNPYMGKYYEFLNSGFQINKPVTSKLLFQPEIAYEREGYPHIDLSLSTTPINGSVSPMPVFSAIINYRYFWFNIHQSSIDESILSLQGQKDPYSNSKWGRALKTGTQAGLNFSLSNSYWLTISGSFDYIWGKNLWENYTFGANLSFGKNFTIDEKREIDFGMFYVLQHYRRNSNFFTFGHGGYFSPQIFHMIGPTFRYKVKDCCHISFDVKTSLGYIYYKTDSSVRYPKSINSLNFNVFALEDTGSYYEGEKKSKFGGNMEIFLKQYISKNFSVYGYGKGNVSAGFNEWSIGAGLVYYFLP